MANTKIAGESNGDRLFSEEDDLHCQALVWNPILSVVDSMVLKCAVKLRLFDSIHRLAGDRPISLPELATSLSLTSPDRLSVLRRLLRYLAHLRLVDVHRDDSYTLTPASSVYLREGSAKSHAAYVKFFIEEDMLAAMHTLDDSLAGREEASAPAAADKKRFFEWMARDPAANSRFNAGMQY